MRRADFLSGGALFAIFFLFILTAARGGESLTDKTLVVWAAPATLEQRGGSALTIDMATPDAFDAVVFGELTPSVWMPGSSGFSRTQKDQTGWPKESANGEFVRIAVCYRGKRVELYRNDERVASYEMGDAPQTFDESATILFGPRHIARPDDVFIGKIRDARIYSVPLSKEQIRVLKPGEPLDGSAPWAWWNFADGIDEKTGRFDTVQLTGDARIVDGALVLGLKKGALLAKRDSFLALTQTSIPSRWSQDSPVPADAIESARLLREKFLADPRRPRWHFAPPEGYAMPGDPNGCFYADGRYHLMYLYNRGTSEKNRFCWGHLSSVDLVHWRHHPDAIGPGDGDEGCFSGGGFLDDDGTAYLTYWMLWGAKGLGIAKSEPPYDVWTKLPENPVIPSTEFGLTEVDTPDGKVVYGSADPTNIWKKDGKYYMAAGNLLVLGKYGRKADSPEEMKGDRIYLFESENLKKWDYRGVFYQRRGEWTDASEDDMCPSFLPLPKSPDGGPASDKHLLLFISHNKGAQYYVGTYDKANDRFLPETHGRMTRVDNTYFAPEALIDGRGRQIMWAWLLDEPQDVQGTGWSGVYGLPRTVWLGEDETLRMRPVPELEMLRLNEKTLEKIAVTPEKPVALSGFPGDSCELKITISSENCAKAKKIGVIVREDAAAGEKTLLYYDTEAKALCFDSRQGGKAGRPALETLPLDLPADEPLSLRVFIDRAIVEVYANDRQAIGRRVFPSTPERALGVSLWSENPAEIEQFQSWEMAPSNPY